MQTRHYKRIRIREVSQTIAFESERVEREIGEMERNAIDLANMGKVFYKAFANNRQMPFERDALGVGIVLENFSRFASPIGGGIWFEPYVIDREQREICFYAYYDPETAQVQYDPSFQSDQYNYLNQMWYQTIRSNVAKSADQVWWTLPYVDEAGTYALMTTVGAGVFHDDGHFVGMSTVDWEIQSMVDRLSEIRPTRNSFSLIAAPSDDYIISNTYIGSMAQTGHSLKALPFYDKMSQPIDELVGVSSFDYNGVDYLAFARQFHNGWIFSVQIPQNEIFAEVDAHNQQLIVIFIVVSVVLWLLVYSLLSSLINRPLQRLTSGVLELGSGNLDKQIEICSKDEIGTLAASFNKMTTDLKLSIEQNIREQAEKERIGAELNIATQIQASMLPNIFPPFPERSEFDIYALMQPAKEVGGDFYDFFFVEKDTLAMVIADVSDKGVPAALFMMIAKTLIKSNAQNHKTPSEVFETVNNLLCEGNNVNMFVTAFLGYLHIPSGRFTYVNAGHNPPLVMHTKPSSQGETQGGFERLVSKNGLVLAIVKDSKYTEQEITLTPDEMLFLYTDGITEADNTAGILFGEHKLIDVLDTYASLPLKDLVLSVKKEIDIFADGAKQADDITMLVLQYKGMPATKTELTIDANLDKMVAVQEFVSTHLKDCSPKTKNQIEIAIDEIFSNIAKYAYIQKKELASNEETPIHKVKILVEKDDYITIQFVDNGIAYEPFSQNDDKDTPLPKPDKPGGLGLFIVKNIMDSVEYQRVENKNILTIKKKFHPPL